MSRALALALAAPLLLSGCASTPGGEVRDAVADVTDAANAGSPTAVEQEVDGLVEVVRAQSAELGAERTDQLLALAAAVRASSGALAESVPEPTSAAPEEPVEEPSEQAPEPAPSTQEPAPEEPAPEPPAEEPEPTLPVEVPLPSDEDEQEPDEQEPDEPAEDADDGGKGQGKGKGKD